MADLTLKKFQSSDLIEDSHSRDPESRELLDISKSEDFSQFVDLAVCFLEFPLAAVCFSDPSGFRVHSQRGLETTESRYLESFSEQAARQNGIFHVRDASHDLRFSRNPLVAGPHGIRFYAGVPLFSCKGTHLGTLSVMDYQPQELTEPKIKFLQMLARQMMDQHELKEARALLVQKSKMASLGELTGGIVHEVNNPLAIIRARAQMIRSMVEKGQIDSDKLLTSANKIDETTVRIAQIISALRKYGRDIEQETFMESSMQEMIHMASELCASALKNKEIRVEVKGLESDLYLQCRNSQIIQVLVNLLTNSIEAIGGQSEKWIRLEVSHSQNQVELKVIDSGPGIPASIREQIAEPFFTTKADGKGAGLGLSVSKKMIESHQGSLLLDEASPNTCFWIVLPKFQPS